jgi:hypothetical protein
VEITHRLPKLEQPQHITINVYVARQIRIGELDLIETRDGPHRIPVLQPDTEARHALSKVSDCAIWKIHFEWHTCLTKRPRHAIEPEPPSCRTQYVRSPILLRDSDFLEHAAASLWTISSHLTGMLPA